ncbi:HlyD family secretion protein [Candidatus Marimicrobium litorale]|uniref:HlyD family secretion protein n=1 Tax=Candidatus Marimicrobium litorale TaxID=2518991 RepID=A0ABT3T1C2_9GAMM|nr:HlyD family secretion protein [Candidatus Marimicrobium litorale]MCX2976063.1 HlyD family secretion protein [Candidatus Marimicrobium litorale]
MGLAKKLGLGVLNLAVIAVIAWFAWQTFEEYVNNPWTRDGQVRGQVIQVAPRVSGMVTHIPIIDNQFVNQGELLFELDKEPFEIAVAQANANLKRSRISSRASKIEYDRLQDIFNKDPGAVSQKDLNRREANYLESLSKIDVAKEDLRGAKLNLSYTEIRASLDGYVSNVDFQIGTQTIANTPILALVDVNSFWVFGYFRESQIDKFKIGDLARVTLMAYPDSPLQGHVESLGWGIAPSDGNAGVKLLPSIKPVFQWIRLAQRIPVRIKLDPVPEAVHLRYGLTASVMIMSDGT